MWKTHFYPYLINLFINQLYSQKYSSHPPNYDYYPLPHFYSLLIPKIFLNLSTFIQHFFNGQDFMV